jgi:hypothetical protein
MQDADLFAFMAIVRELIRVFPKRMSDDEIGDLSKAYFATLRRFTIAELQAGADAWMQRGKFFPKPAEWREAIPHRSATASVALAPLTPVEMAEYMDAERRGFEGDPCACRRCRGAGVDHRFTRYAPESDELGRDLRGLIGERSVVRGRWLHGEELRCWYAARDAFMALRDADLRRRTMSDVTAREMEASPYV